MIHFFIQGVLLFVIYIAVCEIIYRTFWKKHGTLKHYYGSTRKIDNAPLTLDIKGRYLKISLRSMAIMCVTLFLSWHFLSHHVKTNIVNIVLSPVVFIVNLILHDLYFYLTHLCFHRFNFLYQYHKMHHSAKEVHPYSAFYFSKFEALIQSLIFPMLMFLPWQSHPSMYAFGAAFIVLAINGHSGYELLSARLKHLKVFPYLGSPTYHQHHHKEPQCNLGLYQHVYDLFAGTWSPSSRQQREKIYSRWHS